MSGKVWLSIVGGLVVLVALFSIFVVTSERSARERQCFAAGGKIIGGVCLPIEGAIKLEGR